MLRSKRMVVVGLGLLLCCLSLPGCEYVTRFIIRIDEGANFPCLGVYRFTFIIEALEEGQEPLTNERVTSAAPQESDLFWKSDGTCQIPKGILLKNIPYGGKRKITIQAYDSSGLLVASGTSPSFTLEPSGDDVTDLIAMDLVRGCRRFDAVKCIDSQPVDLGTLIVSFPASAPIPPGTQRLFFQSPEAKNKNLPALSRTIKVERNNLPSTVILTGIPASSTRPYTIHALDVSSQEQRRWAGTYSIPSPLSPANATVRIMAGAAANPPP